MTDLSSSEIPILSKGLLRTEAGIMITAYMLFPNCQRSAHQFTRVLLEETTKAVTPDYVESEVFRKLFDPNQWLRLRLCGELALRVCSNYQSSGKAEFSKAAYVVSERNHTNRTMEGKPLPTDEKRLRSTFSEYRASMHFWAAANVRHVDEKGEVLDPSYVIAQIQTDPTQLGNFLAKSVQFEKILQEAKPADFVWTVRNSISKIWHVDQLEHSRILPDLPETKAALETYKPRSGR